MYTCQVCGRESKNRSVIDNCKHSRLKKSQSLDNQAVIETKNVDKSPEILLENVYGKTVRKIYHCSDIHIRLNSQHDQYRVVFSNFYKMLAESEPGVVVCCGDILHNKNELSPECIVLVLDFLENLSKIMPTFIIAGNHDAVLSNVDKMDSLSGILDRRIISNLYYLKNSGVYRYNNVVFGVSSLLDSKFIYSDTIQRNPGDILVGLYHGSVGSPVNDMGYKISGEKPLDEFNGYDLVLLGDIHKFQYLNESKTVAYSSSLISQNFGECDEYHGFLEWDLTNRESIYRIVSNDYRYIRMVFNSQKEINIPNKCNLQVCLSKIKEKNDSDYLESLILFKNMIKTVYPGVRINYVYLDSVDSGDTVSNKIDNLTESMLVYISKRYPTILQDDIEWVIQNIDWNPTIVSDNIHWSLLYMKWDYMCKYGANNTVDFRKLCKNGTNGLIAPNSAGKSTFIDIITFLLFSRMNRMIANRKHIQPDIININQKKCSGVIYFSTSTNEIYMVEKQVSRLKDNNIKLISNFYRLVENVSGDYEWDGRMFVRECLTGKDRLETDKRVSEIIGTYEDFVFHSLFLQFDNQSFRKMSPKERKDFMYRLFSLDFLTKQHYGVRENLKKIRNTSDILKKSMESMDFNLLETRRLEISDELFKLDETYKKNQTDRTMLLEKRGDLYKKLWPIDRVIGEEDYKFYCNRLAVIQSILGEVREFSFVSRQGEIMDENRLFLEKRDRDSEVILSKIMDFNKLKENVIDCGDFDRDRLNVLRKKVFPENLKELVAEYRIRLENCENVEKPDHTREECNQLIGVLDKAMSKLNLVKKVIDLDETVIDRYEKYMTNIANNKRIMSMIQTVESGIKEIEDNYEYNPDCFVCVKNPKVIQLMNMREELIKLRQSLSVVDDSILEEYEHYKILKAAKLAEEKRIETTLINLNNLRVQKLELLDEIVKIGKYEEYIRMETYRCEYDKLCILENENYEYIKLLKLEDNEMKRLRNLEYDKEIERLTLERHELMKTTCKNYDKLLIELDEYREYKSVRENACLEKVKLEEEIELYRKSMINVEIQCELSEIDAKLLLLDESSLNVIQELQREYGEICGRIASYDKIRVDLSVCSIELRRFEYLESILSVDGFSLYLLETNLVSISNGVSEILMPIIGVSLKLSIEDNDLVMYSYRVDGDKKNEVRLDTFGGMEQFMLDLSFRVLSLRYTMLPRSDLFILDETFSCFDNVNLGKVSQLYDLLYSLYDHIIMITHIDKLKDTIHKMINITNVDGYSTIKI